MRLFKSNNGFTLIEIMIALTILATLALLTANTLKNTVDLKRKVQTRVDENEKMRSAMRIMKKDIQTAFHYNNYNIEILDELRRDLLKASNKKQNENPTTKENADSTGNAISNANRNDDDDQQKPRTVSDILNEYLSNYKGDKNKTHFLGSENALHFASVNHARRYKDAQESNIMEVGFYLKNCRSLLKEDQRSQCLWRRNTPFLDEKVDEGGGAAVLLENIENFQLAYYDTEAQDWVPQWYTDDQGSERTKNRFPAAVKIILEVSLDGKKRKETAVVALSFPNNREKKTTENEEENDGTSSP